MMGYGGYGGMFMWLILIALIGVIVYFVLERDRKTGTALGPASDTPLEILKKRYARGEITKEEFDRMKNELDS